MFDSNKEIVDGASEAFLGWVLAQNIKTERGTKFEFENHLFLLEPAADWFPKQVTMKSAQVGWSTLSILKALYALKYKKHNIIYTLPTFDFVKDFVPSKVDPIIDNNPVVKECKGGTSAMTRKEFGKNFMFFRGTQTEQSAIGHTSDLNIYDEYDASNTEVIDMYSSRLQYSQYKGEWTFSNPLLPNQGVAEMYERSDQRKWFIQCSKCKKHQTLEWEKNLDRKKKVFCCQFCKRELAEDDRQSGEWIATVPDRSDVLHGYHVNQLMAPWVKASELLYLEETKSSQYFHNMILGIPYISKEDVVNEEYIRNAVKQNTNTKMRNAMGVDYGVHEKHYVLGNHEGIFKVGVVQTLEEIESIANEYGALVVIDGSPGDKQRALPKKYPGKFFCAFYHRDREQRTLVKWGDKNNTFGHVWADKNNIMQSVVDDFREGRLNFTTDGQSPKKFIDTQLGDYIVHWKNIYKIVEEDSFGIPRFKWEVPNGKPDHFCHATVYFKMALERVPKPERHFDPDALRGFAVLSNEIIDGRIPADQIPLLEEEPTDWRYTDCST